MNQTAEGPRSHTGVRLHFARQETSPLSFELDLELDLGRYGPLQVTRLQEEVRSRDEQVADVRQLSTGVSAVSLLFKGVIWIFWMNVGQHVGEEGDPDGWRASKYLLASCLAARWRVYFRQSNITIPGSATYQVISPMNLGGDVCPQGMGPPWGHQDLTEQLTDLQLQVARLQQVWTVVTDAEMSETGSRGFRGL